MVQPVNAVVLRSEDSGDYDRKVTLYSRELGKFKAKVAGVKKTVSKLRPFTIPFTESRLQVYLHGTLRVGVNDPGKVIGGETLEAHAGLRNDWERMVQASIFVETLDVLTQTFFPNGPEYSLLTQCLTDLESAVKPALVRLRSTLLLLKILGYSLRHHPLWKSSSETDRSLLVRLGNLSLEDPCFSDAEIERVERFVQSYLELFLPKPLKSAVFVRKMEPAFA